MDWFQQLTGFRELPYHQTREKLRVEGDRLHSAVNGKSYGAGHLQLISLAQLRAMAAGSALPASPLRVGLIQADVRDLHRDPANKGALFQVASQFNLLEMASPDATPEAGVTIYQHDHTQGPACAMEAGAATIFRNYFALAGGQSGQTSQRQLDGLADVGAALSDRLGRPAAELWNMRNGYALCSEAGLTAIDAFLAGATESDRDDLRSRLRVGFHRDVEVTSAQAPTGQHVSQVFCSALPLGYSTVRRDLWSRFAILILEAAYEATLLCAACNHAGGQPAKLFLTMLGGGVFGNDEQWILGAIQRAIETARHYPLDVSIVSYNQPSPHLTGFIEAAARKPAPRKMSVHPG